MSEPITPGLPITGFYRMKLVKGGPWVSVRIWHGAPVDPVTGEEMDRSHRWQAEIDGKIAFDVWRAWPYCAGRRIDEAEYLYMRDVSKWAKEYAPHLPEAEPLNRIDLNQLPTLF